MEGMSFLKASEPPIWKQRPVCVQSRHEGRDQRSWFHTTNPTAPKDVLLFSSSTGHLSEGGRALLRWKNEEQ